MEKQTSSIDSTEVKNTSLDNIYAEIASIKEALTNVNPDAFRGKNAL